MTKPATLIRQYVIPRPSRRDLSTSSPRKASTSPQRRNRVAPAVATPLKKFIDIPGPLTLPMLRHSAHVLPRIGTFHHTVGLGLLDGIRDRYGELVRLAKGSRKRPVLYVFDPEMMREVYDSKTTEPPRWDLSPLSKQRHEAGVCPIHGEEPKALWAAIRTLLLDGSLTKNYDAAFDEIATDVTRRLEDLRHAENNALNEEIETEVYRWAMETVGLMIFGIRLGCLDGPAHKPTPENSKPQKTSMDDESPELCSLSSRSMEDLSMAERLVRCSKEIADGGYLVRGEETLKTESETFNRALKAFDTQFSLTEHFLNQGLAALKSGERKPEQVLIEKLSPLDRRILPLAADALLAGVNPLAQTAVVMLQQLSLHAAQQQRAHDEVCWSTASIDAGAGRQTLSYIAACAREVMRLHPVTGGVVRRTMEDVAVGGYEVPEGVDIVLAHGVSSKDEKQWGRAKSFIPERWYGESWDPLKASRAHSMASVPFGENCPATGIVGNMLSSLATRVLDKYRLEWHGPSPRMATTGVNRILKPFYFVLQNAA